MSLVKKVTRKSMLIRYSGRSSDYIKGIKNVYRLLNKIRQQIMNKTERDKNIVAEFVGFKLEIRKYQYLHFNSSYESSWEWNEDVIVTLNGYGMTDSNDEAIFSFNDIEFDTSWDILMPVIQKILNISFSDNGNSEDFYNIRDCIPDINHTYKAVVQFIKEYNKSENELS